ncbi:GtrA family protein [Altererythrobacter sp. ZODW24]|uniref:GtrA family protein n=1 Tax=Altererythrobacter sp. ZODW24 TaxID=2185142 RepID=UPI000DF794CD|nr:GtrA family protein [Altererythrobacter sp. ZODW24]
MRDDEGRSALSRFFTRRVGGMLVRNTVVSTASFLLGLGVLWLLVESAGMGEVLATAIGFIVAQTLHYALGRTWVFRGTDRAIGSGYLIFLLNAGMGLIITVSMFAALLSFTPMHYLTARVVVSVFAGLAMFAVNATFNFRQV